MFSHKLVPRVQSYVNNFAHLTFPLERVQEVTHKLYEPCTSDAYVIVDMPGLTLDDLQDPSVFVFLRTHMFKASTLAVMPRVEALPDFDLLSESIQRRCNAIEVKINGYDEVPTYIDTKTRVIRIQFPPLPEEDDERQRKVALMRADEALKRTLRKLPSPHFTVMYTNTEDKLLNKNDEKRWAKLDVFADIVKDASRSQEFERNDNVKEEERYFPEKRVNLIDRKLYEGSTFIDPELIYDNELLVLGVVLVVALLVVYQSILFLKWIVTSLFAGKSQSKQTTLKTKGSKDNKEALKDTKKSK